MQSVTSECLSRRLIGAFLSTLPAAVMTTLVMTFAAGWSPGAHAAQDAVICPADRINSNGNICTASDVQLASAAVGAGSEGGVCTPGELIEVAIAGTVSLRKGDRYDIGIWVSTDGKPIELRGGSNGAPDEGGAQTCEVLPLPFEPILSDGNVPPAVINSFDNMTPIHDCYDTNANANGDTSTAFLLTEPRDGVVNGLVDVDGNGIIDGNDSVPLGSPLKVLGAWIYSGYVDINLDGVIDANDDGIWSGRNVQDGVIDYDNDGNFGEVNGDDTAPQEFNDFLTVTCQAGPSANGNLLLDSLVTWNVPSDAANVCNPLNPSSYSASFNSSKCSVSSSEIAIQIVGKVTIVKDAAADPNLDFDFSYTNDQQTNIDTDGNPGNDISATSPFTLKHGESVEIYGVIGTRTVDGGPFIPANIVVTEDNLPAGWELSDIQCTGDSTTPVVVDTVAGTATIQLSYNAADYQLSQDDVTCTFVNAEAPATLTVVKNTNGGDDVFNFNWASTNNPPNNLFTLDTSTGPGTASTDIIITNGLGDTDFSITETLTAQQLTAGWSIESLECLDSNNNPVGLPPILSISGASMTVNGMTLNPGDHVTCTYVNNAAAMLTVTKVAQGGDDTFPYITNLTAPWDNFNLVTSGGAANTGAFPVRVPDSSAGVDVTIAEGPVPGWNLVGIACSGANETVVTNSVEFNLAPGDVVNCTFTNAADGSITIVKNTEGADGTFNFLAVSAAPVPFSITTTNNTGSFNTPSPAANSVVTVSETVPQGWDLTALVCVEDGTQNSTTDLGTATATLNVEAGENITCTYTNTQRGQIVINKATDPVGTDVFGYTSTSGTATPIPASFDVTTGVPVVFNNGGANLLPGTYTVTEDDPTLLSPAFDLTTLVCVDSVTSGGTASSGDVPSRTGTINLDPGEVVTCTFTNTQRANLTIQKVVSADGPSNSSFLFTSTQLGNLALGPVTTGAPASSTFNDLTPGVYDFAEDEVDALGKGWALVNAACDDGSTVDNIQLAPGEDVTCTFTNSPLGSATIVKNTVGGDDTFTYNGTVPFDGLSLDTSIIGGTASMDYGFQLDPANNPFGIQEDDPSANGWTLTGLGCVEDGTQDSTTDLANRAATINAQFGEQITCTFTNTLDGAITIRKETLPDGVDQTFSFTGDIAGSTRDYSAFGEEIPFSGQPGTYSSTETLPAGWQITGISCDDSLAPNSTFTFTGATTGATDAFEAGDDTVNVTLAAGESVICSFENTQESSITISKTVIGAGGQFNFGSAALGAFSLTPADNGTDQQAFPNLLPGTFMVAETPVPAGYQLTNIVCLGATNSTVTIGGNGVFDPGDTGISIDLAPGENISCNFTNTQLGSITVAKLTLPTGSPDSFTFTGDVGGNLTDGQSASVDVLPGTYSSVESVLAGWDLVDIQCDDGASTTPSTGDVNTATATFNVEPGEDVVCAFTNVQRATVLIRKAVLHDDGGDATVADFGIISSVGALSFDGGVTAGDTTTYTATVNDVVPSTGYSVSETPSTGYTPNNWSCTDDTGSILENAGDPGGALFTVGPGKTVTCVIINDDIAPTLTLIKNVINDNFGTAGPDDFGISVGGTPVTSGVSNPYAANTPLAIDEAGFTGYTFVDITGDAKCPAVLGGTVTLDEGESVTCTITNNDDPPNINLAKAVNGPATLEANGTYTVVYTVTASNAGTGNGEYDLTDTFSPAAGVTFNSATLAYVAGTENAQTGALTPPPLANGGTWVTAEQLAAGLNESWTVTANFTVNPAVITDPGRICDPNGAANFGFYNYVEGVTNETDTTDNDACTNVPAPSLNLSKVVNGPATLEANGTYTVVYTVTASNAGAGPGIYDLTDTFSPAAGVAFNSATLAYMAGTENDQSGALTAPPLANGGTWVTGEMLTAGLTESWLITANFSVDPAVITDPGRICDPNGAANFGFYNFVTGVTNEVDLSDNDACTNVPSPSVNLSKAVNGPATLEANGSFTVVYTITASNGGGGPGIYDLTDTFSPPAGVTFNSATLAYMAGTENDQSGALTAPPLANGGTWVTGETIAGGLNEMWVVTANFSVDPAVVTDPLRACSTAGAANSGFYNYVEGVVNEVDLTDNDACTNIPSPDINLAKTVNGAATLEANGTYTVVYTVTATNTADGPGVYDLVDTFSPATGVTLNTAAIAYAGGETQTGTITTPFTSGATAVSGEALGGQASETWTITANFTVDPATIVDNERACNPQNAQNTGFYNYVEGVVNERDLTDNDACTEVPGGAINLAKTLVGPAVTEANGTYTVEYTVTATNTGQGPDDYDIVDTFSLPAGVTVNSASIAYVGGSENSQTGTVTSPFTSGAVVVSGESLAAGADEAWTVTANFTVDQAVLPPAAASCSPTNPVANTGFYNAVSGVVNEVDTSDNDTCTDIPQLVINVLAGVCINDVPYIDWDISVTGVPNANTATVRVYGDGGNGSANPADYTQLLIDQSGLPFAGHTLWPGAAVDQNGNGTDWPGWELQNGVWVQVADGLVPTLLVEFEVNPTASAIISYPPQSVNCAPPTAPPPRVEIPVPVDNKWMLLLMTLMLLATGWYFGRTLVRRD